MDFKTETQLRHELAEVWRMYEEAQAAIPAAVAAERERCAKMADDFANRAWNDARSEAWSDEFELLARNIRRA